MGVLLLASCAEPEVEGESWQPLDEPWRTTRDFIVTEMGFYEPDGLRADSEVVPNPCGVDAGVSNATYQPLLLDGLLVDGFDLDGDEGVGEGLCPHADYESPTGQQGIDFSFLHVMDMIRPARPGQTISVVLASAPKQGLLRIGVRLVGVDNLFDDEVEVVVTTTMDAPLIGADGQILAGSSVAADPNPAYQSRFAGRIIDGVLHAGPVDVVIGGIDLLVVEDRVVTLRDAQFRATVEQRESGDYDVEATIGGWWEREDMVEAIGQAILAVSANPGELECVLDAHLDHAIGGGRCNAMSTMMQFKAVSGFITGLDDGEVD